jgi:hypothetical protein
VEESVKRLLTREIYFVGGVTLTCKAGETLTSMARDAQVTHSIIDGSEDLLHLPDLRLVLQEDGRVKVGNLLIG